MPTPPASVASTPLADSGRTARPAPMRFGAAFWAQRTTWPELRDAVIHAEQVGFDTLWVDDHLLCDEGDWTDPKLEGWATIAALAAVTHHARVGLLVSAITFRNPGLVAKLATTLDQVSAGRAVLGLGSGWFEREHEAFGLDFGSGFGSRIDRLEEALPLIRRLLAGERVTHEGRHYRMHDALCTPAPIQPRLPILVGGSGPARTLPLVARHADLWNARGEPVALAAADARLRDLCREIGRDEREIERSVYQNVVVRPDAGAARDAWTRIVARHQPIEGEDRPEVVGTPGEVVDRLRAYAAVGFRHSIWVFRAPFDRTTMDALPAIRGRLADA